MDIEAIVLLVAGIIGAAVDTRIAWIILGVYGLLRLVTTVK